MTDDIGLSVTVLRSGAVLVPVLLGGVLWLLVPSRRIRGAAFLATLWNLIALLLVNALAVQQEWWSFGTDGNMWAHVPVDVILGWATLWGAVPILLGQWVKPWLTVAVLVVADVVAMGSLQPLVTLAPTWWWGEVLAVGVALLPGVALGVLTMQVSALRTRTSMQVVLFGVLLVFAVPTVTFVAGGTGWSEQLEGIGGVGDSLLIQLGLLLVIVALRAVAEFVTVGGGTPFPWDPPTRLVVTGPYAYVANPMQLSAVALLLVGSALFRDPLLVVAAVVGAAFSAGLAAWHEHSELSRRFGDAWADYRGNVRDWIPRWSPSPELPPATLYASVTCDPCSAVGPWFARRRPVALRVVPSEGHPETLVRVRYEGATTEAAPPHVSGNP